MADSIYLLELDRWGIYNDGTHPVETTKGFNDALKWAHDNGKTTFRVPAGLFLIKKGPETDVSAQINIPANMTFEMAEGTTLKKESNGYEFYRLLYVGPMVQNVTIKGGILIGDRYTHDYTQKQYPYTQNTHEAGFGITSDGARNLTIEGVVIKEFTGDGIMVGNSSGWLSGFWDSDIEPGSIDTQGKLVIDPTRIRTKKSIKTDFHNAPRAELFNRGFVMFHPEAGVDENAGFDVYFYKNDGTFLSAERGGLYYTEEVPIPQGADYFLAVFTPTKSNGYSVILNLIALSKQILMKNCNISFNRRQGISVVGAHDVTIQNNVIHDIQGTAPASAIDFELGRASMQQNFKVLNNTFYNNNAYNVILFDGFNAVIEGNYFGKSNIGLAQGDHFYGPVAVYNNVFDNCGISAKSNVTIENNTIKNASVNVNGNNVVINEIVAYDTMFQFLNSNSLGITVSNVEIHSTGQKQNMFQLGNEPVKFSNILIDGPAKMSLFSGNAQGSIFSNLKLTNYHPVSKYPQSLLPGKYTDCLFQVGTIDGYTSIQNPGLYEFNNCQFVAKGHAVLMIQNLNTDVTIENSTITLLENSEDFQYLIYVLRAKRVSILNNVINASFLTKSSIYAPLIEINTYYGSTQPFTVEALSINGNTIYSNLPATGIRTIAAGIGAPSYFIENNTLINSKLELKENDVNQNNQIITL
ncbi:right-handed parallel beta-helix repeat-containing protein [Paenibacillus aceris]|uniref:Right handed beta helix domain-containing protein n=1 Tax=Paenibacillus aceris TaxID=869555 RepID=A0ABS4I7Z0_9BACL|nr:right-handed parallel beta-helix repeat-containing protein [Paenibacillus aceris]MBP1967032.1 hypothetical protein [Paenibacillus aceris]NHW33229.1 right-handed parallel beta-helix repeat-containing protein [Paenibacillus aceris]